jgi:hypothetical protein
MPPFSLDQHIIQLIDGLHLLPVAEKVNLPVARILVVDSNLDSARVAVALKDRDDFESEHRWCHDSRRWCATLWRILRNVPTLEISFEIKKVSIQKLDAHVPLILSLALSLSHDASISKTDDTANTTTQKTNSHPSALG